MEILRLLESMRSPIFDSVFGFITGLGAETFGIVILCVIYWCINKRVAYVIGVAYFLSGLTVQGMKISFRIERPWVIDPELHPVPSAIKNATGYSFPSGHTQGATALFGSIGLQLKQKPFTTVCFFLAILVAFSRMYLGVHTLFDVTAAFFISVLFVLLSAKLFTGDLFGKNRELILALSIVLYAALSIVHASTLFSTGKIQQSYLSDCLKSAGAAIGFAAGMFIESAYIRFTVSTKNELRQIVKFILGFAGLLAIKEGLRLMTGTWLILDAVHYFFMILWITVFFPLIIRRFFTAPENL